MNRKKILVAISLLAAALLLWFFLLRTQRTEQFSKLFSESSNETSLSPRATLSASSALPQPSRSIEEQRKAVVRAVEDSLATPITFYGRIIDQDGGPVANATIIYGALNQFDAPGSEHEGQSDINGKFSVTNIHGAILRIGVRKAGYYMIDGKSAGAFAYGISPDTSTKPPPTKENPAVFILQKMGNTEALIKIKHNYLVPKDGTPVEVDLLSGKRATHGNIRVESWTQDREQDGRGHYDWQCRVSVPLGGLTPRSGQFEFEAPLDGYREFDEITMSQRANSWQPNAVREYFLKFNDGRFARIRFEMIAGGDHFFEIESYLNPAPGSRNLEFDPSKQINK